MNVLLGPPQLLHPSPIQHPPLLQPLPQLRLQKLPHAHIPTQTLPPTRLDDKIPRRGRHGRHLQRTELDFAIERIPGDHAPFVKDERDAGLALGVDAHVGLEAEAVDDGDQAAHAVQRGAGQGPVGEDVPPSTREDGVQRRDGVGGAGHGD